MFHICDHVRAMVSMFYTKCSIYIRGQWISGASPVVASVDNLEWRGQSPLADLLPQAGWAAQAGIGGRGTPFASLPNSSLFSPCHTKHRCPDFFPDPPPPEKKVARGAVPSPCLKIILRQDLAGEILRFFFQTHRSPEKKVARGRCRVSVSRLS